MDNSTLFDAEQVISQPLTREAENLFKIFGDIHNFIYANDGLSAQEAFAQILNLLFLKLEDERRHKDLFYITSQELNELSTRKSSPFITRINSLFTTAKSTYDDIFSGNEKIDLKPTTLAYVVDSLQKVNLTKTNKDVTGIAFQKFVFSSQRGDRGQFFTPDAVMRLCVEVLAPKPTETILDPACGTGGFLAETFEYIRANHKINTTQYAQSHLRGMEISFTVSKIAKMRMLLAGDGHTGIVNVDSLGNMRTLNEAFFEKIGQKNVSESFDIILTNPPFGTQGKITDKNVLKEYQLGYKWDHEGRTTSIQNGQVPEILFIERCLDLLKPGGRMAIVLPNGDFENPSLTYVRDFIKSKANILAVIALPPETFIPHGTGVRASVLFLQKKDPSSKRQKNVQSKVFFSRILKIGYEGNKHGTTLYKRSPEGIIQKDKYGYIVDEDVSEIAQDYKKFQQSHPLSHPESFSLKASELEDRLDVSYYNPSYRLEKQRLIKAGARPLSDVVEIVKRRSPLLADKSNVINYIELSDINTGYGEISNATRLPVFEAPSRATYELKPGNLITAVAGNSVGTPSHATALVTEDYEDAVCTNGFRVLKATGIHPYYLFFFLRSSVFLSQMYRLRTGAAIPSVSDSDLANVLVPIPPKDRQNQIAQRVQESLALREQSKAILDDLKETILISK